MEDDENHRPGISRQRHRNASQPRPQWRGTENGSQRNVHGPHNSGLARSRDRGDNPGRPQYHRSLINWGQRASEASGNGQRNQQGHAGRNPQQHRRNNAGSGDRGESQTRNNDHHQNNSGRNNQQQGQNTDRPMRGRGRGGRSSSSGSRGSRGNSHHGPDEGFKHRNNGPSDRYKYIGEITLQRIARTNTTDIFLKLNEHKEGFMNILNSPILKSDIFVLVFEILSKVSKSPFDELKSRLILDVCNSNFITFLMKFFMDLPYAHKSQNELYFKDENAFWKNFITFCGDIVDISPAIAVKTCRPLIDNISKTCLDYLSQRKLNPFVLPGESATRLDEIRNKLIAYANGERNHDTNDNNADLAVEDERPPEDFRELSVIPTREDLLGALPFLRPNIVDGGYSDVEHYLDVQFRLLREDCFGPLRVGISQYLDDPNKRRYDHVRVYRNVKFAGPYVCNFNVGTLIQIDIENSKHFTKINWAHSKRFLFGSLVLFTNDRFANVIVATILDRDNMMLATGKLAVSIIDSSFGGGLRHNETYTMIESEVYYEPYLHVLKALQAQSFPRHLAMQQYIVKVTPASEKPAYLTADTEFVIKLDEPAKKTKPALDEDDDDYYETLMEIMQDLMSNEVAPVTQVKLKVLQPETWPTSEKLNFNESQYEAYKLALTHEFAVIQGPPGTGKTYVGLSIAKTLLHNVKSPNSCVMLVICYTNHALDQFLEGISKVTRRIVRIGSQSRNKAMDEFNLTSLRKQRAFRTSRMGEYYFETKTKLKQSIGDFQLALLMLDIFNYGVINYKTIKEDVPQMELLCNYYNAHYPNIRDPLEHWLFENHSQYYSDFNECLQEYEALKIDTDDNEYNNMRTQHNILLDDEKKDTRLRELAKQVNAVFYLLDAKLELKKLVINYLQLNNNFKEQVLLEMAIQDLNSKINLFNEMRKQSTEAIHININGDTNFSRIAPKHRWSLYFMWIQNKVDETKREIATFQAAISPVVSAYEESRMLMDMELLRSKQIQVLGMTTSGAARMRKLLQAIAPKIVIVEEAAEVLEQHIITSLTKDCQHLILIGDHQQLRPSASYMKLARQYNIEVSLFERMITNGIHSRRLSVQHRMRPEIAALISPHIYPVLENHPSVHNFGDVLGMDKNVFFFSHQHPEENQMSEGSSRSNCKEADLTLALANYLIQQGYSSDDVTILAAYSGQMFYMRNERRKYACLAHVKITVVDNYQGEESKIILLSLVRNNSENIIGFLGTENRICVALSRAKQGFYMFGNINMLKSRSPLWGKIATTLEENGSVGSVLKLKCQVHPDQITEITSLEDFNNVPEGGCFRKCNYQYTCGHRCLLFCHGYDREHVETKCNMPCERVLCDLGHVCPQKCRIECEPCRVLVKKTLPCGHDMNVFCHREPDDPQNKCRTKVDITLPGCGHEGQKECYMKLKDAKCIEKCKQRLVKCGHACERLCHVAYPSHDDYMCMKDCAKPKKGCSAELTENLGDHQCMKKCCEACDDCNIQVAKKRSTCKHVTRVACCVNIDDVPCAKKCSRMMDCGHFCTKKCVEKCGDCKTMVTKVIPECNHELKIQCMTNVARELCYAKCTRTLSCGHPCKMRCGAICDPLHCKELTDVAVDSPCGHKVRLPCNLHRAFTKGELESKELLKYCKNPCGEVLACTHICGGSCSQCMQGRLHAPCTQTCNQLNICGHQCQEPCNKICPPCSMLCEVKCKHSHCGQVCGEPCVLCKEQCSRSCRHGACARRCSEPCSHAPCSAPCPRALPCGHRCRGLCGETCPDVCKLCRPDDFPRDFLGDEYEEDDKFILLEDCGHVMELENMDNLMKGDQDNIKIRQCPFCRKPIINTNRYKDIVNNMFRNEINPIKQKIYGNNKDIKEKLEELNKKAKSIFEKCGHEKRLRNAMADFMAFIRSQKKMFLLQVEMLLMYCNIIEMITECWETYKKEKITVLQNEMEENVSMILQIMKINPKSKVPIKIGEQQQKDIGNEIKRLNSIIQLAKLIHAAAGLAPNDSKVKHYTDDAKARVLNLSVFDEDKAVESLRALQTALKSGGIVSKLERKMIVTAIGLKAGHWFKCPNGHFYCIGECGGAVQTSTCPECGQKIGGSNYALASEKRLRNAMADFMAFIKSQKKMFLLQVEMLLMYCNIIEMITECWETYKKAKITILQNEMEENVSMILQIMKINPKSKVPIKIGEQQQKDIGNEIKRLNSIIQLAKLIHAAAGLALNDSKVKHYTDDAKARVLNLSVFDEDKAVESLRALQTALKSGGIVSKLEREMIVTAIGLKAGHWFKCPNGHFYCIGECGGAMQTSTCPECGEKIGGSNHALLSSNSHAREMDGSKFAAYSVEANNMANFIMEDF